MTESQAEGYASHTKWVYPRNSIMRCSMATFRSFEDIEAWQASRVLTRDIYGITASGRFRRDGGLCGQIQRASVSVMANIAEGFERDSNREFARYLRIARGSLSEVRSHLFVARDIGYINDETFAQLNGEARRITAMLNGLVRYLSSA